MQMKNKSGRMPALLLVACCAALFSFSSRKGGDSFEIYVNNKLVLQQYVMRNEGVKNLSLQQSNYNDQLRINYSHCGQVGKDRVITIKDGQNRALKQWRFADAAGTERSMTCKVKDIIDLKKGNTVLQLYYSSRELPGGRLLASINSGNSNYTKL